MSPAIGDDMSSIYPGEAIKKAAGYPALQEILPSG
jgi:hypothetical protein